MKKIISFAVLLLVFTAHARADEDQSRWFESYEKIPYTELRALIDNNQIEEARVLDDGWWVTVKTKEGEYFDARVTPQTPIADHFYDAGVPVSIRHRSVEEDDTPLWLEVFYNFLPLLIFIVFFVFIMFAMRGANKKTANKYDDYLAKSRQAHEEHLRQIEKSQNEFLERLEKILKEQKDSNG